MGNKRPLWSSKYSFILTAIGSAVGLGNIWRFPYIMGQYGGAVFLAVYILIVSTICFIPLINELYIGKFTKKECIGAYETINPKLTYLGVLNPITSILITSFYFVVGGWIIYYIIKSFSGNLAFVNNFELYFSDFTKNSFFQCVLTEIFMFICLFLAARGLKKGIEASNKILMPLLAVILIFLVCTSLSLPNAQKGLEYMFKPDFSKLNFELVLAALGQAFFTLSLGSGILITYGSYIKEDKTLVKSAYTIILSDTIFAILSGIMIFPIVFSFNMTPNSGAGLVFVTLPQIFSQLPNGNFAAGIFFVLLLCAAITSGISLIEVSCASLIEKFNLSRVKACIILFLCISFISIPTALSFGILNDIKLFDKTIFDILDFLTSNILMLMNAVFLCLISGWYLKINGNEIIKNKFLANCFNIGLKYIVPIILLFFMFMGLN